MIIDNIRNSIKESMKAKESDKVALLRLVIGTAQQDGDESDLAIDKIIRKIIKSNKETLQALQDQSLQNDESGNSIISDNVSNLLLQNNILESFIPKTMTIEDIVKFITKENIEITGNEGKVMGNVIKALKSIGLSAQGSDVKSAIKQLVNS